MRIYTYIYFLLSYLQKRKKKKPSPKTSETSLRDQLADSHSSLRDYFPDPALRNYLQGLYVSTHAVFQHILISAKCENKYMYWILCENCETAKFENISHKDKKKIPIPEEKA